MFEIVLFGEDRAHERVVGALLQRLAKDEQVAISPEWRQAYGGHGRMRQELNDYLRALHRRREPLPDLIVAATDANCKGLNARTSEIADSHSRTPPMVLAIPDPHVERWLLLDGAAFKAVFDRGCQAPDQKCDRNRYKQLLTEAILAAGIDPGLGGIEYADEIMSNLDIDRAARADDSFRRFVDDLRTVFRCWRV